jgi:ribonuclease D
MRNAILIDSQDGMDAAVFRLHAATRLALDTEFMRERTYYAKLCLVQLATDNDCFLIDPLAGLDLAGLFDLLMDPGKPKILHAARQDLEILFQAAGRVPAPIFDTQLAAAMLGYPGQAGYADLVASELGHSIDKGQTRTDWSRRPLSDPQLAYAADDVHHLLELHTRLSNRLEEAGRSEWLLEEAGAYADAGLYQTDPADAWRRVKGFARLQPVEQNRVRALAQWRERRAIDSDKPRGWILKDAALLDLGTRQPRTVEELEQMSSLPAGLVRRRGNELLDVLDRAQASPSGEAVVPLPGKPTAEEMKLTARLMQVVREVATSQGITPEVLATRRDIEALARGAEDSALLRGWRARVIGEKLSATLRAP